jgi:hypothetical protein
MLNTQVTTCTRCDAYRETIFLIARPGGMSWTSSTELPDPPKDEHVCADCLTDNELGRILHPVVDFVLDTMPRDPKHPSTAIALETVATIFKTRNNEPCGRNRRVALRAVGFQS